MKQLSGDLETYALQTLHLSHYRAALLVAYFRFLQVTKLTSQEILTRVNIT